MRAALVALMIALAGCAAPAPQPVQGHDATPSDNETPAGNAPCARVSLAADRTQLKPPAAVELVARVENCSDAPLPIPLYTACAEAASPGLSIENGIESYQMYAGPSGSPPSRETFAHSMGYCIGLTDTMPTRLTLAPGAAHEDRLTWNGSVIERTLCPTPDGGGRTGCIEAHVARPGLHRIVLRYAPSYRPALNAQFGALVEDEVVLDVLAPEGPFLAPFQPPTRDPAEPLEFDPARPVSLARDANGTLARVDEYRCEDENGTVSRCFGQQLDPRCHDAPRPTNASDADHDKVHDDLETHLLIMANSRARTIVSTDCSVTWSDIHALRAIVGDFPVNGIWLDVGFGADLAPEQVAQLAQRDDVRAIEGVRESRTEREWSVA